MHGTLPEASRPGSGERPAQLAWTYLLPRAGEHREQGETSEGLRTISSSTPPSVLLLSSPSSSDAACLGMVTEEMSQLKSAGTQIRM